jgi:hypothetical protein
VRSTSYGALHYAVLSSLLQWGRGRSTSTPMPVVIFTANDLKKADILKQINICKGKGKVVLLLTEHHAMKACWGSGSIASLIL